MKKKKKYIALEHAVISSFGKLNKVGTSKHQVKQELYKKTGKHLPSPYIHGASTFDQYIKICRQYARWLDKTHTDVRKLAYAKRMGYAREYIQIKIDAGQSSYTTKRAACALAKLYRCTSKDIHPNQPERHEEDIKNSRGYTYADYERDEEKYGSIVEIARMTGLRKCELAYITKDCFDFRNNDVIYCHIDGKKHNAKGGRNRKIEILPEHRDRLKEILSEYKPGEKMFPKIPGALHPHAIRAMYAGDLYNAVARSEIPKDERIFIKDKKSGEMKSVPAILRKRDGRKFDRAAFLRVSHSLGHNRVDVVSIHYSRFCKPLNDG